MTSRPTPGPDPLPPDPAFAYCLAEGPDDHAAVVGMWSKQFGDSPATRSAGRLVANAMRNGALILTRSRTDGGIVGATILDFTSYGNSLFIPFLLVARRSKRADVLRAQFRLVLGALAYSGAHRLIIALTASKALPSVSSDFQKELKAKKVPLEIKSLGQVSDLYGDGRDVTLNGLFISSADRPDLVSRVVGASGDLADLHTELFRRYQIADCSGCSEGNEKSESKDAKDEPDKAERDVTGSDWLSRSEKLSPEKASADSLPLAQLYSKLGASRCGPRAEGARIAPLV